ncbi:MAG: hypothetical protein LBF83_07920 [Spirochaetaceae bacterium]|jgi:hypothetical protein|nr:hypothetical protein [Spirochaetaceae bacterium]
MMTAEQAAERGKTLSFEKVWAMFEETDRKFAETERFMKESSAEMKRIVAETQKELAAVCKRVYRVCDNVGGLNTRRRFTRYTMARDARLKLGALTKTIIHGIEDNSIRFDKSAEVLEFLRAKPDGMMSPDFLKIWLEGGDEPCFNFNGAKVPYLKDGHPAMNDLVGVFSDTFLFHVLFDDDYGKNTVTML